MALRLTDAEVRVIVAAMSSRDLSGFRAGGIAVGGIRNMLLRSDGAVVLGKKKGPGAIAPPISRRAIVVVAEHLGSMGM